MTKDSLLNSLTSTFPYQAQSPNAVLGLQAAMNAHSPLGQVQSKRNQASLADCMPDLSEVNNPDSAMVLTIPVMRELWAQRHGHRWVDEESLVSDRYWALIARRLHGLGLLERMETTVTITWEHMLVFRLKDDDADR